MWSADGFTFYPKPDTLDAINGWNPTSHKVFIRPRPHRSMTSVHGGRMVIISKAKVRANGGGDLIHL
ncbi:MAG: hypothetical protein M3458_10050 [Acidobacteriota bacterium]|nr:hypothetical protein [Acidobacteriota bacterium]